MPRLVALKGAIEETIIETLEKLHYEWTGVKVK